MIIREFAENMHLRIRHDGCGDRIIPGKRGHIYEHSDSLLGLVFLPDKPRLWANAKRKLRRPGVVIRQDGDGEGAALFDPAGRD